MGSFLISSTFGSVEIQLQSRTSRQEITSATGSRLAKPLQGATPMRDVGRHFRRGMPAGAFQQDSVGIRINNLADLLTLRAHGLAVAPGVAPGHDQAGAVALG